jgi:hypothetical protein
MHHPTYFTTHDLMSRWGCSYRKTLEVMHRKGSRAIKPAKRLLIDEREVIAYEQANKVRSD